MTPAVIVALIGLSFTILLTWGAAVAYAIRPEGRINLVFALREADKQAFAQTIEAMAREHNSAIGALAKFDENTQTQVENYQQNTERKIDELNRSMTAKSEKVFDKIDGKADKD
jgi:hypothetical protein